MNATDPSRPEHLDVLIIGAGISGLGVAVHLGRSCPQHRYAIVEARARLGGTWDLFRYPGIRSDSDLYTFGYDFKPWRSDRAIASGADIQAYLEETADEFDVRRHIRFQHRVVAVNWLSAKQHWAVTVQHGPSQATTTLTARWVFAASGYYNHAQGHAPEFKGVARFAGTVVHPQHWPEGLDVARKRVVVIGSGATAVTLVPALCGQAEHVTLLQRTPSYVLPVPTKDKLAQRLRPWLGDRRTHAVVRWVNIARQRWVYAFCMKHPQLARRLIRRWNARMLPPGYPVDVHFNPPYQPWEQRLCAVPGGDLFKAISSGQASMVTDHIDHFTPTGIQLASGQHLPADVVVTATGLNLHPFGGIQPSLDGVPVPLASCITYKGMMFSGVPNFAVAVGYTSSSWTLKVGLLCEHFVRLLQHMQTRGLAVCTPQAPPGLATQPLLNFGAGYVQRSIHLLPRQGQAFPWTMSFDYASDAKMFRKGRVDHPALRFETESNPGVPA